jgi:hypothetical protein
MAGRQLRIRSYMVFFGEPPPIVQNTPTPAPEKKR